MKIAMVNKIFFLKGGQETLMFEEAKFLEQAGHEVAYFSIKHPDNIKNYPYENYFADYVKLSNVGKEYSVFKKLNIAKNFIYNKQAAINFEIFINDFKPDIIHCHGIAHQISTSILFVAKKYNIPVVQTLHDYQLICPNYTFMQSGKKVCSEHKCLKGHYYNCLINKCVKNSYSASFLNMLEMYFNSFKGSYTTNITKFISPSLFLYNKIIASGINKNQIVHIPNFIDIKSDNPPYHDKKYFLYAGVLSPQKGLFTLLKAFRELPNTKLIIAGKGTQEEDLINFVKINNLKNVTFKGFQDRKQLKELLKNCTALILPSEWYENAPMSIIESFSCAKPVIGTNLGGIPEMIKNGYNGYIFKAGNYLDLKTCIRKFSNSPEFAAHLGENARNFALENYTSERHLENLLNLYFSLLNI